MAEHYERHGVKFRYPESWPLTEEGNDQERCVTVSSPDTSFWSLTLFFDCPSPDDVADTVLQAFRDEYQDLDAYPVSGQIGARPAIGADIEFVALDLINSAFLRVCRTERFTAVVLYQGTDFELERTLDVLEAISSSLELDDADEWPDFASREDAGDDETALE